MPAKSKVKSDPNMTRVINWLVEHRNDFEQQGISEDSLIAAIQADGAKEIKAAIDHLENREDVVRWPQALLKPGRNWTATRDKAIADKTAQPG